MSIIKTYSQPFLEAVKSIVKRTLETLRQDERDFSWLDDLEDGVFIKSRQSVYVEFNKPLTEFCEGGNSHLGEQSAQHMDKRLAEVSQRSDELIFGGASSLEFQHNAYASDGRCYTFHTYKHNLTEEGVSGYDLLGISRPIAITHEDTSKMDRELRQLHHRFIRLNQRDQDICRLTVLGLTSREIGEKLGISSRAIEMRKQKIFETLDISKSIELARKLVRMEERGILKLGLDD